MTDRKRIRLLLVEDSRDDEQLMLLQLARHGYDVEHRRIETEEEFRAALVRDSWDVVVSDFFLPRFSGPTALAVLRSLNMDVPFIIVSGTVGEATAVECMKLGAHDYVLKGNLTRLAPAIQREVRDAQVRNEQRRLREQLLVSDRLVAVGSIASAAANELNNPLAIALANLELAEGELGRLAGEASLAGRLAQVRDQLRDARDAADRLRQIVADLKLFSRPREEDKPATTDARRVIDSALRMAWNELRHRATVRKDFAEVTRVSAHEARLGQVLLSLLVTSAQSIPDGNREAHRITVSLSQAVGRVSIEIRDNGDGLARESLPEGMENFFTSRPVDAGSGLSLAICKRIVAGMGGELKIDSARGRGTRFRLLLVPVYEPDGSREETMKLNHHPRRGHVLIVDDEPMMARAVGRTLESQHDVELAASGQDALTRVTAGERFDVIICDLMMPQMSGIDLHAELSRVSPELAQHMVFMTGGAFTKQARAFLDQVPNPRIEKPFDSEQLRALVADRLK